MGGGTAFIRGASYVLGEQIADHAAIENFRDLADGFRLAPNADLWGWGSVRATKRDLADLAADAGTATMLAAGAQPSSVDALLLCSNRIPGPAECHGSFVASVLTGIGLGAIPCYGLNLNRCVNLLAGLDIARALVTSGRHRTVLVITTDRVADKAARVSPFALYSDGAASCMVTVGRGGPRRGDAASGIATGISSGTVVSDTGASDTSGYELLGCATAQDTATLEWGNEISSDLARQVNDRLLTPAGLKLADLTAIMHANLFKPLVVMKERQAGFSADQLYLDNIPRVGHCFAADPLINLVDRAILGQLGEGSYCVLASSVPGSRIGVLLRRVH